MSSKVDILLIEDNPADVKLVEVYLRQAFPGNHLLTTAITLEEGLECIAKNKFDIIVSDISLPDSQGMETFTKINSAYPEIPLIILTGWGDGEFGLEAVRKGAADFINKNKLDNHILVRSIAYSIERNKLQKEIIAAKKDLEKRVEERTRELQTVNEGLHDEIAKRKLAEERILQLIEALNKTNNAIMIADKDGKIEWVNEGFKKLTGYTLREVKDNFIAQLNPDKPTGLNPDSVHYQELMRTKKPVLYEMENFSKSGKGYWTFTTLSPIFDNGGNVEKIIAIDADITKMKEVEMELIKAKEISEQSVKVKEQFMANMSHEIRTPMNAVIGFANLLSRSKLDATQTRQIKAIQTSGENLLNIINDILDFSKIESGMMGVEKIPFSPAALVSSVKTMFAAKAVSKNLQLDFNLSNKLPETVTGDPTRLTQILVNLIGNALKFTSEGIITVKVEVADEKKDSVSIQFAIKDTGIGIPKEKLTQIFERFTQADSDTSRKYGGSGLGLSIVKKLIDLQGGSIHVESAEGFGSSFTFIIPYKKSTVNLAAEKPVSIQHLLKTKIKILVAEDNVLNQELAESLLSQWGFDFDIVENGKLAIEKLLSYPEEIRERAYDLVLMDIQMPEMDGYDAAEHIREKLKLRVPIVAMTAHVMAGEKEKCLTFGMNDYISKPVHETELYNLISRYVNPVSKKEKIKAAAENNGTVSAKITNLDYLNEISGGSSQFVTKMVSLFLSEIPKETEALQKAIHAHDMEAIYATAHKIKSTIPFAGLDAVIGNQLSSIEDLAANKSNLPQIEELFLVVKEVCAKAIEELKGIF